MKGSACYFPVHKKKARFRSYERSCEFRYNPENGLVTQRIEYRAAAYEAISSLTSRRAV
jgi:hypothetical protein